jgi:tetratricopeptide (TPR) repeat protein
MRTLFVLVLTLCFCPPAGAQHTGHKHTNAAAQAATIVPGIGGVHHPVSTTNPEAQKFFDQGLAYVFAFNHDEAIRSFKRAAELDQRLGMAHWGMALALGPNINLGVDPAREKAAYDAVQKASALAANAPENERAYIAALAKRYSIDPKADLRQLDNDYKHAMGELVKTYPDDLDLATLYAESAMDLRPWKLWTADGKPAPGSEEIVAILESVLHRNPNHPGAIHYYIHAVEASPNPERALAYAPKLGSLMPAAGHLVHMPAHIYARTGDYQNAALSNQQAAVADEAYIKAGGLKGIYPLMYYSHNLHFLAIADSMQGRFTDAMRATKQLEANVSPHLKDMPMLEGFMTVKPLMLVRFNRWDDIEKLPQPEASLKGVTAVWHFARGVAFANKGDLVRATAERAAMLKSVKEIPADASFGLNPAHTVMSVADEVLRAHLASAKHDDKAALALLRQAEESEDSLAYDEPPAWFLPVREMLGGALMKSGNYADAEQVFRADLQRNKRNGRSLFGLMLSLRAQKKTYAAELVEREFDDAWKSADIKLELQSLWQ